MSHHNHAGTVLSCANPECGCKLRIEEPCPHGDEYKCACGHPLEGPPEEGEGARPET